VILIVREQIVRTQTIKSAACLQLGENDLSRYWMTLVKINGRADL